MKSIKFEIIEEERTVCIFCRPVYIGPSVNEITLLPPPPVNLIPYFDNCTAVNLKSNENDHDRGMGENDDDFDLDAVVDQLWPL